MRSTSHLEALALRLGYISLQDYLKDQYQEKRHSLEAIAAELEVGIKKVRELLLEYKITKAERGIPITLREAKRMGPDAIAKAHGVSRATAWRWKRAILDRKTDA